MLKCASLSSMVSLFLKWLAKDGMVCPSLAFNTPNIYSRPLSRVAANYQISLSPETSQDTCFRGAMVSKTHQPLTGCLSRFWLSTAQKRPDDFSYIFSCLNNRTRRSLSVWSCLKERLSAIMARLLSHLL